MVNGNMKLWKGFKKAMEDKGIIVKSAGRETLSEEMSEAYKDISNVVDVVHNAGISKKVARLRPIGVIKG
jgi:tRNA-splicing ligase RtcB